MRMHPLLALFTTTFSLTATGFVAGSLAGPAAFASRPVDHLSIGGPDTDAPVAGHGIRPVLLTSRASRASGLFVRSGGATAAPLALALVVGAHERRRALSHRAGSHEDRDRDVSSPPAPRRVAPAASPATGVWLALRTCESGSNYRADTGNGYFGAYQFLATTWWALGYHGLPSDAPVRVQDQAARVLEARAGWRPWPQCAALLGLH